MITRNLIAAVVVCAAIVTPVFAADAQPDLDGFAKAAAATGLTCDLGPLSLRQNNNDRWVIELRCASKDDGRIGVIPKKAGAPTIVYDCVTAKVAQLSCANTKEAVAYPAVNTAIRKFDVSSECRAKQTQLIGLLRGGKSAYLEVKCDDPKLDGQVLQYDTTTLAPMALIDCNVMQSQQAPCRLPGSVVNAKGASGNTSMMDSVGDSGLEAGEAGVRGYTRPGN